jgi:hypothetical protein
MRTLVTRAAAATALAVVTIPAAAQKAGPADVAARLTGTWTINRALSPALKGPGRAGAGRGGSAYALGAAAAQRGGRGGGASDTTPSSAADLTPAELAERQAIQQVEQIAPSITIKASAESASIVDQRGELTCAVNDKNAKVETFGAPLALKCRWDKQQLRQEFSATRSKLVRTWEVNDSDHLVLKIRIEGVSAGEATAVFDRSSS